MIFSIILIFAFSQLDLPTTSRAETPRWFYVVILSSHFDNENWTYSAFVFPKDCTAPLSEYEVTIYDLMELTRYSFLHKLLGQMRTLKRRVFRDEEFEEWAP